MNTEAARSSTSPVYTPDSLPPHSKRCPRCGELLFDDMDVCFGCLYDFTREPYHLPEGMIKTAAIPENKTERMTSIPKVEEVFELEEAPELFADEAPTVPLPSCAQQTGEQKLVLSTKELRLVLPIPSQGLTLGQAIDNDIVLTSKGIADHHLMMLPRENDVVVIGLAGCAFTVKGVATTDNCTCLHEGDVISLNNLSLGLAVG